MTDDPRRRRIAVVTGTRADYGLLYWLMREIDGDPELELQLIVTGMHLSPEFGSTWRQIVDDGFIIDDKVEMLLSGDTPSAIAKSTGLAMIGFADAFQRLDPDIVVLLGDRFEMVAAGIAAHLARIPIAHLSGGEVTEGAVDEAFRHCLTKMAQLHFVAAEPYRKRVIQMGEDPSRVFCVGSPGLDHLERMDYLSREELEKDLGLSLASPLFLITYHPVTLQGSPEGPFRELLAALDAFPGATMVFTYPNADTEGRALISLIDAFVAERDRRAVAVPSLGQRRYLSLMRLCDAVIGNSSSGLTEAPSFGVPTINLGDRQKGRLRASSVLDCPEDRDRIIATIQEALRGGFKIKAARTTNPYGSGGASKRIKAALKEIPLEGLMKKSFFDLTASDFSFLDIDRRSDFS